MSHQIRFDPDDAVPLTYCQQVSPKRFEQQGKDESGQAVRQLLEHIIDDKNMSLKDKRKRLKQVTCGLNSKFCRWNLTTPTVYPFTVSERLSGHLLQPIPDAGTGSPRHRTGSPASQAAHVRTHPQLATLNASGGRSEPFFHDLKAIFILLNKVGQSTEWEESKADEF